MLEAYTDVIFVSPKIEETQFKGITATYCRYTRKEFLGKKSIEIEKRMHLEAENASFLNKTSKETIYEDFLRELMPAIKKRYDDATERPEIVPTFLGKDGKTLNDVIKEYASLLINSPVDSEEKN